MPIQFDERDGPMRIEVLGTFQAEDADLVEAVVERLPAGPSVEVDFRRAREKQLPALWRLAQAARRAPGRYRLTGLTMADSRFLALLGEGAPESILH